MKTLIGFSLGLALIASGAQAQKIDKATAVVAEQDRHVAEGRAVQVTLQQTEIATTIELGRVATAGYGGGVIGMILIDTIDDDNRDTMSQTLRAKAQALAEPLRLALRDFDVDAVALAATRAGVAKPDWFQAREVIGSKEPWARGRALLLASSDASQFAYVRYRYELSPDFSQIRVIGEITLMPRNAGRPAGVPETLYRQRILSVVQLRTRSYEPRENVALWSAENGKLAKAGLTAAFGQFEQLIPYALGLGQRDIDALMGKKREKAFAAGFYGPLIARNTSSSEDVLIWADGLVHVQSVP
ncbi:MAG: hypothetical protein V4574_16830 [Pseudomonadota bacterium]